MSLRFDWYPKYQHEVIISKSDLIIDRLITKGMAQRTKEDLKRTTQQILSALYSAYTSLPKDTTSVSISLTSGHYSGTLYSFRMVQRIYECLSDLKWIKSEKGSEYKKKITRMWASGELSLAFDELLFTWIPQKPKPKNALVVLRNFEHPESKTKKGRGKKTDLSVPETAEVNQYRSDLYRYNQFLLKHCISLRLDDENLNTLATEMINKPKEDRETWETEEERVNCLDIRRLQLRRIFSRGSLEQGGRFYGGWWQSLPEIHRPHITINGKTTIEIDFSTIALRILYAQQGIQVDLERDLYDIGLEDWSGDSDPRRKPIKTYVNAILNDERGNYRLNDQKQKLIGISHQDLHKKVLTYHEPISHLFNSGIGLHTQFIDSLIAERVMLRMMEEDKLVLPIHDSFIVNVANAVRLLAAMLSVFEEIMKAEIGLSLSKIKWNHEFSLKEEEVRRLAENPNYRDEIIQHRVKELTGPITIMEEYLFSWMKLKQELISVDER